MSQKTSDKNNILTGFKIYTNIEIIIYAVIIQVYNNMHGLQHHALQSGSLENCNTTQTKYR